MKEIKIKQQSVPKAQEIKILKQGLLNPKDAYGTFSGKVNTTMSTDQVRSFRKQELRTKAIKRAHLLNTKFKKITRNYFEKSISILNIAKQLDLPPLMIMERIFKHHKKKKTQRDLTEFAIAAKHDILNNVNHDEILKYADAYEKTVEVFLKKHRIPYITQETLVKQQTKKHGRPISTPDFLLKSPVIINGRKIHWIDAKNYYGCSSGFLFMKGKEQARKYILRWGEGALCYALGYSEEFHMDNVLAMCVPRSTPPSTPPSTTPSTPMSN